MLGFDAIIVMPLLFLVAIAAAYALVAFHSGIYISAHTCGECGMTMPTDEAYQGHMEGHRTKVVRITPNRRVEKTEEHREAA